MENFLKILTKPDNIPIAGMVVAAIFLCWLSFRKAFENDRLIRSGRKEEIIEKIEK